GSCEVQLWAVGSGQCYDLRELTATEREPDWQEHMERGAERIILDALAAESRRVLSDWRALLYLRRAGAGGELGRQEATDAAAVEALLLRMVRSGELLPVRELPYLFEAAHAAFAFLPLPEHELMMEANPYAALAYLSAFSFHDLTNQFPNRITAIIPRPIPERQLPSDTTPEDWIDLNLPPARTPDVIQNGRMNWLPVAAEDAYGIAEYRPYGYPVRVTNVERTLIDGLLETQRCGGMENVLSAWGTARDGLDVDLIVAYVGRSDSVSLRQRIGFLLEAMELTHPTLNAWAARAQRRPRAALQPGVMIDSETNSRWNLSINAPIDALYEAIA
ncbi:MAG: type IV toxin-antitoxin system AbiEi family antitoxin domain-containing protein, partial [Dehalococcoidia bacterium]